MNPIYTYMFQPQPYVPWKDKTNMLTSAVPTWSRPIENGAKAPKVVEYNGETHIEYDRDNGAFGKARPIKHWRKQLDPRRSSGRGRPGVGMPMDVPGGKVALGKKTDVKNVQDRIAQIQSEIIVINDKINKMEESQPDNKEKKDIENDKNIVRLLEKEIKRLTSTLYECECKNAKRLDDYVIPDNRYQNNVLDSKKNSTCCRQANVIKPATTVLSKNYYTDSRAYLKSRGKRFQQNLSGTEARGIEYVDNETGRLLYPSDKADGIRWRGPQISNGEYCPCPANLIYKPNNREFSVQGAVDSSSRVERLKLKTITKSANSMGGRNGKGPFGMEGVNASRYRGNPNAPYFLKSKNEVCHNHHRDGDHTVCFLTPTGSIGNRFPLIPDTNYISSLKFNNFM